jgi:hypothetical protein
MIFARFDRHTLTDRARIFESDFPLGCQSKLTLQDGLESWKLKCHVR